MRRWAQGRGRGRITAWLAIAACSGTLAGGGGEAHAEALVLGDGEVQVTGLRVAVASSPAAELRWVSPSVKTRRAGQSVGVVVPLEANSLVDLDGAAFLAAADEVTAPRIVAGLEVSCPEAEDAQLESLQQEAANELQPAGFELLSNPLRVAQLAIERGWELPESAEASLYAWNTDTWFLVLHYDVSAAGGHTLATVRVHNRERRDPSLWLPPTEDEYPVTTWFVGAGQLARESLQWSAWSGEARNATWYPARGESDYVSVRDGQPANRWVLEATTHAGLTEWAVLNGVSVPGLHRSYFDAAFQEASPAARCRDHFLSATESGDASQLVDAACPLGALAQHQADDCTEDAQLIAASELRCAEGPGEADDLALALSGLAPGQTWLTRAWVRRGADSPRLLASLGFEAGTELPPFLETIDIDTADCYPSQPPEQGFGGMTGGERHPDDPPVGEYPGDDCVYSECYEDDGTNTDIVIDIDAGSDSCSGDSSEDDGGCSGDSSEDDGGGCSGDSSDDGGGCSGDSSDDGGGCSGDSSGDGGGCSGDSSGGDGCSGDSSSSSSCGGDSSGDCSVSKGKRRRGGRRVTSVGLGLFALLFPLRRLTGRRRKRAG